METFDLYAALAQYHHYTPEQIANMNIFQKLAVLKVETKESAAESQVSFESVEDYIRWRQEQGFA